MTKLGRPSARLVAIMVGSGAVVYGFWRLEGGAATATVAIGGILLDAVPRRAWPEVGLALVFAVFFVVYVVGETFGLGVWAFTWLVLRLRRG